MTIGVGIRLEDKNEWETRVPLVPEDVNELASKGVDISVQRFARRCFRDEEFEKAGAKLVDDTDDCDLVLGVKEIPLDQFRENQAYMFFSHTIKGQSYNMKMLAELVKRKCSLLDYETVKDAEGRRLIFFGRHAGIAGAMDTLWALGRRLEDLGTASPFSELLQCRQYDGLNAVKDAVLRVGEKIKNNGLPPSLAPLVIGITGYGNVSQGAQEIVDLLPTVEVAPDDLTSFVEGNGGLTDRIVKVVYEEEDLVEPVDSARQFGLQDYYDNGTDYRSKFGPHLRMLTVLMNGIYWDERYPKLADEDELRVLYEAGNPRLTVVGDITCDVDGSLACTVRDTGPGDPCFVYDPVTRNSPSGFSGAGLQVMAVSNLPCELPVAASQTFSEALKPFVARMAAADWGESDFSRVVLPDPIARSVILWHGKFTPDFAYMEEYLS